VRLDWKIGEEVKEVLLGIAYYVEYFWSRYWTVMPVFIDISDQS
jgi:hypothetical protein